MEVLLVEDTQELVFKVNVPKSWIRNLLLLVIVLQVY